MVRSARSRTDRSDDLVVRAMRPGEEPQVGETGLRAFRIGDVERWTKYFRDHGHLQPGDVLVAERDGEIAAAAAHLRFQMSVRGVPLPVGGVAAVSVAPEARRQAVADRLLVAGLHHMRKRGDLFALLYAFRLSYYRRFGYGVSESQDILRVHPAQLPASPERRRVRRLIPGRDDDGVRAVYEALRLAPDSTGQLERSEWWWTVRGPVRAPEGAVYRDAAGKITGYLLYSSTTGPTPPGPEMTVMEVRALDADAFRGLYGFLESLRDQVEVVQLMLPHGTGAFLVTDHGTPGIPRELESLDPCGLVGCGAMARLLDVAAAFAAHPAPAANGAAGRLGLDLDDPVFSDQSTSFDVTFGKKGARVERGRAARDRLSMTADRLAPIVLGALSARTFLSQGLIGGSPRAAALLDAAFAGPRLFLGHLNGF